MTDEENALVASLVEQIDALMPEIEKAIGAMWDRGDYFNGPRFGTTLEAVRALASAIPPVRAKTVKQGLVRSKGSAVGEAETP